MYDCVDASKLGLDTVTTKKLSPFGFFWFTFLGCSFLDNKTNTIKTKAQIYHRDPVLAIQMAKTLLIPNRYELLNSIGWKNGFLINN